MAVHYIKWTIIPIQPNLYQEAEASGHLQKSQKSCPFISVKHTFIRRSPFPES